MATKADERALGGGRMTVLCDSCSPREGCTAEKNRTECKYFQPMTEQEYIQTCTTEQLAEWILDVSDECFDCGKNDNGDCPFGKAQGICTCINKDSVVRWLKQPHTESGES